MREESDIASTSTVRPLSPVNPPKTPKVSKEEFIVILSCQLHFHKISIQTYCDILWHKDYFFSNKAFNYISYCSAVEVHIHFKTLLVTLLATFLYATEVALIVCPLFFSLQKQWRRSICSGTPKGSFASPNKWPK